MRYAQDIEKTFTPRLQTKKQATIKQTIRKTNKAAISASKLVALESKQSKGQGVWFPKPTPPLRTTLLNKQNKYHWLLSLINLTVNKYIQQFPEFVSGWTSAKYKFLSLLTFTCL